MIRLVGLAVMAALASPALSEDAVCLINVDGTNYLSGPCETETSDDGTVTVGVSEVNQSPYFAYLIPDNGAYSASWNGAERGTHAHTQLGIMTKRGDCWANAYAEICASPNTPTDIGMGN